MLKVYCLEIAQGGRNIVLEYYLQIMLLNKVDSLEGMNIIPSD